MTRRAAPTLSCFYHFSDGWRQTIARRHDSPPSLRAPMCSTKSYPRITLICRGLPNRGRRSSDGRPGRDPGEVARWAEEHRLPIVDGRVRFPDVRLEYETRDGRLDVRDVEVTTPHYRGAHAAAKAASGFARYRAVGARLCGGRGAARGGRCKEAHLAEEMLR